MIDAALRNFRAHDIAGGVDRDCSAHNGYVPAFAAGHRAPARCLDRPGSADDLGLFDRLRGRATFLRADVGPSRPQAGAAGGADALLRGEPGLRTVDVLSL